MVPAEDDPESITMKRAPIIAAIIILVAAPLVGGWVRGFPDGFSDFPPLIHERPDMPGFSWWVFTLIALLAAGTVFALCYPRVLGFRTRPVVKPLATKGTMPPWGWAGLILAAVAWTCAWGQFDGLGSMAEQTFFPLWLGYILVMDGMVFRRRGRSMVADHKGRFLILFPASAASWWYFEFLNRFVQNWWYEGSFEFSALRYIAHASICFSTVLPAVFETADWLNTCPWFRSTYANGPRRPHPSARASVVMMVVGAVGLGLLTCFPAPTFYLVWLAPLSVLLGALWLSGVERPLGNIGGGDYGFIVRLMIAALVCGFFWEMWNFWSMPKWNYGVPYVQVLHLFEMPALGYTGYLPFGPICWCFWLCLTTLAGVPQEQDEVASG